MIISPKKVWFDEDSMWVAERERFELSAFGIHWEHLDEDISVEGLLAGQGDLTRTPIKVA